MAMEQTLAMSSDLQPLFHQLVFECKIHSALYGMAFSELNRAFAVWQKFCFYTAAEDSSAGGSSAVDGAGVDAHASEVRQLRDELEQLQRQLRDASAAPVATESAVATPATTKAAARGKGAAVSELNAFRIAREQLQRNRVGGATRSDRR